MSGSHTDENLPGLPQVNLEDVRKLEMRYSGAQPDKMDIYVEYVGGQIKVFEVDRYLVERLLEQLENQGAQPGASTPRGNRG
jgi:hypothetical protein